MFFSWLLEETVCFFSFLKLFLHVSDSLMRNLVLVDLL